MSHPAAAAPPNDVLGLVVLFTVSGSLHLVRPGPFERIVPHRLPARRGLVYASGVAELLCAGGLLRQRSRRAAGLLSACLLVAVFPANIQMTVDVFHRRGRVAKAVALARLPLQVPLVRTALRAWFSNDATLT